MWVSIIIWSTFFCVHLTHAESNIEDKTTIPISETNDERSVMEDSIDLWDTGDSRFNHLVAIKRRQKKLGHELVCVGSILTPSTVLTACHCLVEGSTSLQDVKQYLAIAGIDHLSQTEGKQVSGFREFVVHEKCDVRKKPIPGDLGLGFLDEGFLYTKYVGRVPFLTDYREPLEWWFKKYKSVGQICYVLGWSCTDPLLQYQSDPYVPQNAPVRLVNDDACDQRLCYYIGACKARPQNLYCGLPYGGNPVCNFDTGGPLMCGNHLFGIKSISSSSGLFLEAFSDPITIIDFIQKHMIFEGINIKARKDPPSTVREREYVVSILGFNGIILVSHCAGVIMSPTAVVTTCTCLKGLPRSRKGKIDENIIVIAGITKVYQVAPKTQVLKVDRISAKCTIDEEGSVYHDVGILYTKEKFRFTSPYIELLTPPKSSPALHQLLAQYQRSGLCYMAAWAYSTREPMNARYHVFSEYPIQLYNSSECRRRFCVDHRLMCTDISLSNKAMCGSAFNVNQPCFADNGGAVICNGTFVGIVTYNGELCSKKNIVKIVSVLAINDIFP